MWRKRTSEKPKRLRVGLALSGGAARGIAHVGVLKISSRQKQFARRTDD
jgi:predicted acylesterase/phospholipase RssA